MADIAYSDLYARYGKVNVLRWADLDNTGSTTSPDSNQTARMDAAIAWAEARVYGKLRKTDLANVLTTWTVPTEIKNIEVQFACYRLSIARGVKDYDPKTGEPMTRLYADYRDGMSLLNDILHGEHILSTKL